MSTGDQQFPAHMTPTHNTPIKHKDLFEKEGVTRKRLSEPTEDNIKVSMNGRLYVIRPDQQPEEFELRYAVTIPVAKDNQIYNRWYMIGTGWEKPDLGWLVGLPVERIIIQNMTGLNRKIIPTPEQSKFDSAHVVHVGFEDSEHFFSVRPADCFNVRCESVEALRIRSTMEDTKIKVVVIPGA